MVTDQRAKEIKKLNTTLGINVTWFRKKKGITQDELAELINYGKTWVSKVENHIHRTAIKKDAIQKLADVLDTTPEILTCSDHEINTKLVEIDLAIKVLQSKEQGDDLLAEIERLLLKVDSYGPRVKAELLRMIGSIDYMVLRYDSAFDKLKAALDVAQTFEDGYMVANIEMSMAKTLLGSNDYDKAMNILIKRKFDDEAVECDRLHLLGYIYSQHEKWEEAVVILNQALQVADSFQSNPVVTGELYQYLGVACLNLDQLEKADFYSEKAIQVSHITKDELCEAYALRTLGQIYLKKDEKEKAAEVLKQSCTLLMNEKNSSKLLETRFLLLLCSGNLESNYHELQIIADTLEGVETSPRVLVRMYQSLFNISFELARLDGIKKFHDKTMQYMYAIIK